MIKAEVHVTEYFARVTEGVEHAVVAGLNAGAQEMARTAQEHASIDLKLQVAPAHGDVDGFTSSILSRKTSNEERSTRIGPFFDGGTLGGRRAKLKRPRRRTWKVTRGETTYTAHRQDVTGKGIKAERFFTKARAAGRAKLLEQLRSFQLR